MVASKRYVAGKPARKAVKPQPRRARLKNPRAAGRRVVGAPARGPLVARRASEAAAHMPTIRGAPQQPSHHPRSGRVGGARRARETVPGKSSGRLTPTGKKAVTRMRDLPTPRAPTERLPHPAQKPARATKSPGPLSRRPSKGKGVATRRLSRRDRRV